MKKVLSILLSFAMLLSITAGIDLTAFANETTNIIEGNTYDFTAYEEGNDNTSAFSYECDRTGIYHLKHSLSESDSYGLGIEIKEADTDNIVYSGYGSSSTNGYTYMKLENGKTYNIVFETASWYDGDSISGSFSLSDTHIVDFEYVSDSDPVNLYENTSGHVETDDDGNDYYFYECRASMVFDTLIVKYDETYSYEEKTYTADHINGNWYTYEDGDKLILDAYDYWTTDQYDNHWQVGNTYKIDYTLYGIKKTYQFSVNETPYESISIDTESDIEFDPVNDDTYISEDDNGNEYVGYSNTENKLNGKTITLVTKDGESRSYTYRAEDYPEQRALISQGDYPNIDAKYIEFTDPQNEHHWTVDGDNYLLLNVCGCELKIPVKIADNGIVSAEFTQLEPFNIYENTNGSWETDANGEQYYRYNYQPYGGKSQIKVTYKDGTEKIYTSGDGFEYYDEETQETEYLEGISWSDDLYQYNNHWQVGNTYGFTFYALGFVFHGKINIVESPYQSIDFTPVNPIELTENKGGYQDEDGYTYRYDSYAKLLSGGVLTVTMKNGDVKKYTYYYGDDVFVEKNENGEIIDELGCRIDTNQYDDYEDENGDFVRVPWSKDNDNCKIIITAIESGMSVDVPVKIVEDPVDYVKYIPGKDALVDGDDVYVQGNDVWSASSLSDIFVSTDSQSLGAQFVYVYKDGSQVVYTCKEVVDEDGDTYRSFVDENGNPLKLYANDFGVDFTNVTDVSDEDDISDHFVIGKNTIQVTYNGKSTTFDIEVKENPVASIEYNPASPLVAVEGKDSSVGASYDEEGVIHKNDYYDIEKIASQPGSTITLNYKDGTKVVYTSKEIVDEELDYTYYEFLDSNGNMLSNIFYLTVNSSMDLTPGETYTVKLAARGLTGGDTELKIQPTDVEKIELITDSKDAYFQPDWDLMVQNLFMDMYSKAVLRVTYKDGTVKDFENNPSRYGYFVNGDDEMRISDFFDESSVDTSLDKQELNVEFAYTSNITYKTVATLNSANCTHDETTVLYAEEATCGKDGYTGDVVCTKCHMTVEEGKVIPKTNKHTWNSGVVTTKPTCKTEGVKTYTCSVCSATKTEAVAKVAHTWDNGKITKAATCTANGVKTYTCTVCKTTKTEVVKATGHKWNSGEVTKKATCTANGVKTYTCTVCKATKTEAIKATGHTYKWYPSTPATTSKDGKSVKKCSVCGKVYSTTTIYKASSVKLSAYTFTYNGKAQAPNVVIKDSKGNVLKHKTHYIVTYPKTRTNTGRYAVQIKFIGNYSGTTTLYYNIVPKTTSIKSLTANSKGFTVKWNLQKTQTTGYQIQYSTSSNFSGAKTVTIGKNTTSSTALKKLSAKKKYYVRIRTYRTIKFGGKNYVLYSSWSGSKNVVTKK